MQKRRDLRSDPFFAHVPSSMVSHEFYNMYHLLPVLYRIRNLLREGIDHALRMAWG